jgi:hypothetical protein
MIMMERIQGTHISHLICLPFLATFFFTGDSISCAPPSGQAHEQNALPRKMDARKSTMKKMKLPHTMPFSAESTITYGEKYINVAGKRKKEI